MSLSELHDVTGLIAELPTGDDVEIDVNASDTEVVLTIADAPDWGGVTVDADGNLFLGARKSPRSQEHLVNTAAVYLAAVSLARSLEVENDEDEDDNDDDTGEDTQEKLVRDLVKALKDRDLAAGATALLGIIDNAS